MSLLREAIEAEIQAIADANNGTVTPSSVVDLARDPAHPLHEEFEWDDQIAAEQHRLMQARTLIRSIRVSVMVEQVRVSLVAYVHDPDAAGEQGYVHVGTVKADAERARRAIAGEMSRIRGSAIRARDIALGVGQEASIERLIEEAIKS